MANNGILKIIFHGDDSDVRSKLKGIGGLAQKGFGAISTAGSVAAKAVGVAFTAASSAIGAGFAASTQVGSEFEKSMSQVAATMGTTVDSIGDIQAKAMELGASTSFSASQAADGFNILAMSGLNAQEQIEAIGPVLNLAAAGALSLDQAASYTTGTLKGFGRSMDEADKVTNILAKGATLANTDVNALGAALSGSAASAKNYGQDIEGTSVALLRLAEQNVTGAEASTALNRAMMDLYTPTSTASKALAKLGVSAYDSQGNAREFNQVIDELNASLAGMSAEEANATKNAIFSTFGLQAFNKMTASSADTVDKFREGLAGASDGMGAAAEQAETQLDNLQGKLTIFRSAAEGLGIVVYQSIQGSLGGLVEMGTEALGQLTEAFKTGGVEGLMEAGGEIIANLITGAIEKMPDVLSMASTLLSSIVHGISANFPKIVSTGETLISNLVNGLIKRLPDIIQSANTLMFKFIDYIIGKLPQILETGVKIIVQLAAGLVQAIPQMVARIPAIISAIFQAFNSINWAEIGHNIIEGAAQGIAAAGPTLITNILAAARNALSAVKNFFGIKSPSRVMRDVIGKNMIAGINVGIEEETPELEKTSTWSAQKAVGAMQDVTYTGAAKIGQTYGEKNAMALDNTQSANGTTEKRVIEVPVNIDGREVARATAVYTDEQLAWEAL